MELEMSLKRKTGAEQEARLARQEVEGLTQARDWSVFMEIYCHTQN